MVYLLKTFFILFLFHRYLVNPLNHMQCAQQVKQQCKWCQYQIDPDKILLDSAGFSEFLPAVMDGFEILLSFHFQLTAALSQLTSAFFNCFLELEHFALQGVFTDVSAGFGNCAAKG